jgi:osmotically-inducible protein OsmY
VPRETRDRSHLSCDNLGRSQRIGKRPETAVAAELRRDPLLASRDIRVVADRRTNTVTLIGEVASQAERQRATRVAEDAFAVGHVRNRLQVRQDP